MDDAKEAWLPVAWVSFLLAGNKLAPKSRLRHWIEALQGYEGSHEVFFLELLSSRGHGGVIGSSYGLFLNSFSCFFFE